MPEITDYPQVREIINRHELVTCIPSNLEPFLRDKVYGDDLFKYIHFVSVIYNGNGEFYARAMQQYYNWGYLKIKSDLIDWGVIYEYRDAQPRQHATVYLVHDNFKSARPVRYTFSLQNCPFENPEDLQSHIKSSLIELNYDINVTLDEFFNYLKEREGYHVIIGGYYQVQKVFDEHILIKELANEQFYLITMAHSQFLKIEHLDAQYTYSNNSTKHKDRSDKWWRIYDESKIDKTIKFYQEITLLNARHTSKI